MKDKIKIIVLGDFYRGIALQESTMKLHILLIRDESNQIQKRDEHTGFRQNRSDDYHNEKLKGNGCRIQSAAADRI